MKGLFLFFVFFSCSFNHEFEKSFQYEKQWKYGNFTVITGFDKSEPVIEIFKANARFFFKKGGDGAYGNIDTLDINRDGIPDFVFETKYEDGSTIGIIVSVRNKSNYRIYNIADDILYKYDCSTAPYDQSDSRIKSFIVTDIDKNGKRDIITMAIRNKNGGVSLTSCSKKILYEEIQKMIK